MLDACIEADGTDDLRLEGRTRILLEQYLSEKPSVPADSVQVRNDIHKPVIYKGEVTVHTTDLRFYLGQTGKSNESVPELAAMLTALGARAVRIRERIFGDQSRRSLPLEDFPPHDYGIPNVAGDSNVG